MFAFGSEVDGQFVFVQTSKGEVYTYPTEEHALQYFNCVKSHSHLYRLANDLSTAQLIKEGDNLNGSPSTVAPTEEQKHALWSGYVYKSLLAWAPYPDEVTP
jgi:hypothetical protein